MKKWLQNFLENEPPYHTISITAKRMIELGKINNLTIDHFCLTCGKVRTFKCETTGFDYINNQYKFYCLAHQFDRSNDLSQKDKLFAKGIFRVILLDFQCQHECSEHHYFAIRIHKMKIEKIGQYPSFAKEEVAKEIRKYKNIISGYYPEFTKALSAYSQNMGVPSFVYLRRILEHLVDKKANLYGIKTDQKFDDKLHEVEKYEKIIPVEFNRIKNDIYSILSKGVHEYLEDECIKLFPKVKFIIERILDAELQKKEKGKNAEEANKTVKKKLKEV